MRCIPDLAFSGDQATTVWWYIRTPQPFHPSSPSRRGDPQAHYPTETLSHTISFVILGVCTLPEFISPVLRSLVPQSTSCPELELGALLLLSTFGKSVLD